jgi:hypothetical protein
VLTNVDERGQVQPRVTVERKLIVDDLVRNVRRQLAVGQHTARDVVADQAENRGVERDRDRGRVVRCDVSAARLIPSSWSDSSSRRRRWCRRKPSQPWSNDPRGYGPYFGQIYVVEA